MVIRRGRGLIARGGGFTDGGPTAGKDGLPLDGLRGGRGEGRAKRSLRPARWSRFPRRTTLLKTALVAALLAMAAAVLWLPPAPPDAPAGSHSPTGSEAAPLDAAPLHAALPGAVPSLGAALAEPDDRSEASAPDTDRSPASGPSRTGPSRTGPSGTEAAAAGAGARLPAGTVGVPVRIAEPALLAVVRPGARVDLLQVPASAGSRSPAPVVMAAGALVLDVVHAGGTLDGAGALYLALPPDQAHRVVAAAPGAHFAAVVRS